MLCTFLALFVLIGCVAPARAEYHAEFVRLHVVAASDSPADQAVKLRVRDACLDHARTALGGCRDADAAYAALCADRAGFAHAARAAVQALGSGERVRVQTGVFAFPDRLYGDALLPAGEYRALRVTIGAGAGHNWWCVLYPSLCALDESVYASGEEPEIEFYSAVWEWLRKLFSD